MRPTPGKPLFILRTHTPTGMKNTAAEGDHADAVAAEAELLGKKLGQRVDAIVLISVASYIPPAIEVTL